tara:strand:- start:7369 stop:8946 length:1578 start_codon:yes stop_codon:yes gene_type:complete
MRAVRRYQQGGEVRSLLERLAAQSQPLPRFQSQPAVSESTMTRRPEALQQQLSAGESMDFAGMLRDMQRAKEREEFESMMGRGYPMESGRVESVTPMKFVSPVGDVEDIFSGLQMAGRGVKEGDLGKVAGGAGLSLAAGAMAFLPGNLSMMRSYAQSVNNPALDRIFKGIGRELESPEDIAFVAEKFSKEERAAIAKDAQELIDLSFDEFSGLNLSNTERLVLEEIKDISTQGAPSSSLKLAPSIEETRGLGNIPESIGDFQADFERYSPNEVMVSYTDRMGNYAEINSASVSEKLPNLAKEYGDRYAHSMNMDMTELKKRPNANFTDKREQAKVMNTLMSNIQKGDLIGIPESGSLSSDSYPMFLTQIKKGNKYISASDEVKKTIKNRGVKIIDKVSQEEAISFRTLNDMGRFRNYFGIPEKELRRIMTDELLTGSGTSKAYGMSVEEADKYLLEIKNKYIDPKLKEVGLPAAKIEPIPKQPYGGPTPKGTRLLFPYPIVEKLRYGGKLKVKKKRKKGMRAKKR